MRGEGEVRASDRAHRACQSIVPAGIDSVLIFPKGLANELGHRHPALECRFAHPPYKPSGNETGIRVTFVGRLLRPGDITART